MKSRIVWSSVAIIAVIGLVAAELARHANTHDYASRRSRMEWPAELVLDRNELGGYLRHQFNVEIRRDADGEERYAIRAGLCQLAGHGELEPGDILAADATLLLARQPWFGDFVERERTRWSTAGTGGNPSPEDLRALFIADLVADPSFQAEFSGLLEVAAANHDVTLRWVGN